ncbi:nicotianamine synthase family protein [Ammoniphilus sp. 3BR4]|uniref:nicotianamine synthase family protein n=1 Tax=Ammoniphilus sp. 3BR4 TaxID=3158265 RepID=UPI00346664DF
MKHSVEMVSHTDQLIESIYVTNFILNREKDLSPRNPMINETLTHLVKCVSLMFTESETKRILADLHIQRIRNGMMKKLAQAETEMEFYYAQEFARKPSLSLDDLKRFLYWDNYEALIETEIRGLQASDLPYTLQPGESVAFVGSGPLPLSAVILAYKVGGRMTCIDVDERACESAKKLIMGLGLEGEIFVECTAGENHDYGRHPLIFMASLVPNKAEVISRIRLTREDAVLAVRSADGVRELLYEPVDEKELSAMGCTLKGRTYADSKIINSTLFYRL